MKKSHEQWKFDSSLGPLYLVASKKGLQGIFWKKQKAPFLRSLDHSKILDLATKELTEYFAGKKIKFTIPLDFQGTEFQKKVWNQLRKIPYGKTCSYKDIAQKINNKKAFRAVGTANGKNPLCIIIPCHRVIASDGGLGGYNGGLHLKIKLLNLETKISYC